MRTGVELDQFLLGKKTAKVDFAHDPQLLRQLLQMRLEWALARDDQLCVRQFLLENREGAQRSRHPFFRDQAADLHETPAAVDRRIAPDERKFVERNTGAIDAEPLRRAAEGEKAFRKRLGTREDQRHGIKEFPQFRAV